MNKDKAIIITIGDELLIGQVVDTNSSWLGSQLIKLGIETIEKITVSDTEDGILRALDNSVIAADYIIVTGGLGPTKDDITKKVLAKYFDTQLVFHEPTWNNIQNLLKEYDRTPTDAHKEQCFMPSNATILENNMGTAPGMLFENSRCTLISMPGVPYEMKSIFKNHVIPLLNIKSTNKTIYYKTILTAGRGESKIAEDIEHITEEFSDDTKIAFLPGLASVRLRIMSTGTDGTKTKQIVNNYVERISQVLGDFVYGFDDESMVSAIGNLCKKHNLTLGTAESCTGGKVASTIVDLPGTSAFYQGSIISYSNELKENLLGINNTTIRKHGAVSEETVIEMVEGALEKLGVDVALSISGIAGPTGGTVEKPVGLVWICCGNKDLKITKKIILNKNRQINIEVTAIYALDMLRKFLLKNY